MEQPKSAESLLLDRLAEADLAAQVSDVLFAALAGQNPLDVLDGATTPARPDRSEADSSDAPVGTYLKAITVEGFRGIGEQAALRLSPGPGLTLVIGRNGSGKSSFAEAAELALTGENRRWAGKSLVWRDGWRNLHHPRTARIAVELAVNGVAGTSTVVCEWQPGADLSEASAFVQLPGKARTSLDALGWASALDMYRPFLSYAELGALVDGKPSDMYDALQAILSLDRLLSMERLLGDARKIVDPACKLALSTLPGLRALLTAHPDQRARTAEDTLAAKAPDLDLLAGLAVANEDPTAGPAGALGQLAGLQLPDSKLANDRIRALAAAETAVGSVEATPAGEARRLATLLQGALAHHHEHPGQPCPVCGGRPLGDEWATSARAEIERLTAAAGAADAVHNRRADALRQVRDLLGPVPAVLRADLDYVNAGPARTSWQQWTELVGSPRASTRADEMLAIYGAVTDAVTVLRETAQDAEARRSVAWQPVATALAAWVEQARAAKIAKLHLEVIKKAETWLKDVGHDIRNERLAPLATLSAEVWQQLRQESNVDLGPIHLEGNATRRRVTLDVTVDGLEGAALSVMSQGELHALGLALFLPRATTSDSPFRFLLIDDPVQSMDPAKVDGLARVLDTVARTRQVIVFTHDDRLPDAVRRLQVAATIWEVVRREQSQVELKKSDDPITRYLDDARALALATELSEQARAVVVVGFCRSAIEAACQTVVRARQLHAGIPHAEVERNLGGAQTLHLLLALTLFDDASRGDSVTNQLHTIGGAEAVRAFKTAKSGTHEPYSGDLMSLISDTEHLIKKLTA